MCSIVQFYRKELWSRKLSDSVLDILEISGTLVCAFPDGYISVLDSDGCGPPTIDPILYRVDSTAVQCIIKATSEHMWCGSGKAIIVISTQLVVVTHLVHVCACTVKCTYLLC